MTFCSPHTWHYVDVVQKGVTVLAQLEIRCKNVAHYCCSRYYHYLYINKYNNKPNKPHYICLFPCPSVGF